MKLQNPILITLNNVPHIKADNLEPVEVEQHSANEIYVLHLGCTFLDNVAKKNQIKRELKQGIPLPQELSDRIEVREERILLAKSGGYKEGSEIKPATIIEGNPYKITYKAFLLPEKEDELRELLEIVDKKSYTIEEIEKAIEESNVIGDKQYLKSEIINNLKK